jgi:two-component system, OmpR family, phosphate regulon sensor histidine kinase PhoR
LSQNGIIFGFLGGLGLGLGLWFWSSRRAHQQLNELIASFPKQPHTQTMPPRVRLLKAVRSQQQSEQLLHQRIGLWRNILQAAPIGYLEVNREDCLYWLNTKAATLLNVDSHSSKSALRRPLLQVIRSYELDRLIESVRFHQSSQYRDWIFHALRERGEARDLPIRGYGFPLENGHIGVFLESRWESVQLADERDRWTSDVAHELKTPLTSIRLLAETLQPNITPAFQPWMDRLIQETIRLSVLVQDILDLSQMTFQNDRVLDRTTVDLAGLIQSAWVTLEPLAQAKNLSLYYEGPDHHTIQADGNWLLRVMLNLIDNSIKFSPVDRAISIYIRPNAKPPAGVHPDGGSPSQQWTQIDVIDSGEGFPEESLTQVFKRFYKADPSRKRPIAEGSDLRVPTGGGSGLGLAIAHQIIKDSGGTIEAKNHPELGGAWIQIVLPNVGSVHL